MNCPKKSGFTLIELLIVIAILGILAAAILVAINPSKRLGQARDAHRKQDLGVLARTLQAYWVERGVYPDPGADFYSDSTEGTDWIPNLAPGYLKKLPTDPQQAGIIWYLAKLIPSKMNESLRYLANLINKDRIVVPALAASGSQTYTADSTDGYLRYNYTIYPPEEGGTCAIFGTSPGRIGQNFTTRYFVYRNYLAFDTSALPDDATVTQVTLQLTLSSDSTTTDFQTRVRYFDWQNLLDCADWGGNPPTGAVVGTYDTSGLPAGN